MYGRVERDMRGRLAPGQDLVVAGTIGLRGAALLARTLDARLRERFSPEFVERAQALDQGMISGAPDGFEKFGATECEEVSEGGVMAALWNLTGAYRVGMEIELKNIPILQETVEVCELADVNPYRLMSGGCYLLAADSGWALARSLQAAGIPAAVIGRITKDKKRLICNGDVLTYLDRPQMDELDRIKEQMGGNCDERENFGCHREEQQD